MKLLQVILALALAPVTYSQTLAWKVEIPNAFHLVSYPDGAGGCVAVVQSESESGPIRIVWLSDKGAAKAEIPLEGNNYWYGFSAQMVTPTRFYLQMRSDPEGPVFFRRFDLKKGRVTFKDTPLDQGDTFPDLPLDQTDRRGFFVVTSYRPDHVGVVKRFTH